MERVLANLKRAQQRLVDARSDVLGLGARGDGLQQDRKFVSAEPRHRVGRAHARREPFAERAQQRVADVVT